MPSFFGSRRRGSSAQPPVDRITNANATMAASAAMYQKSPSMTSLSSAAAAAALRSRASSPEPVGSIQTKRMVRRGSVSSVGSGSVMGGPTRGGMGPQVLSRQSSTASMSERTFRVQSPARNGSLTRAANTPHAASEAARRRSTSLEPPPVRAGSSTATARGARAHSMDRSGKPVVSKAPPPVARPPSSNRNSKRLSDVAEELDRADSNRNRNFSRPMATPSPTPPASPSSAQPGQPSRSVERGTDAKADALAAKAARIQSAATQAPKAGYSEQPSLLSRGPRPTSVNTTPAPAPAQEQETVMVFDPNTRTFVPRTRDKPKVLEPPSPVLPPPQALPPGSYDPNTRSIIPFSPTPSTQIPPSPSASPASKQLALPSANDTSLRPGLTRQSSTSSPNSGKRLEPSTPNRLQDGIKLKKEQPTSVAASTENKARVRNVSASPSPARSAHFSASPVIEAVKHDPPPRALSPVKSAMKHSPASSLRATSPRAASPLAHLSPGLGSDISDTASQTSQDGLSAKKRKSVRVSFDDHPQEAAAGPTTPTSPKQEARSSLDDLDDEVMAPRPALPSFGSVRRSRHDVAEKVTEVPPARDTRTVAASSDKSTAINEASVAADEASDHGDDRAVVPATGLTGAPEGAIGQAITNDPTVDNDEEVPEISLQPPTPGEEGRPLGEEEDSDISEDIVVPGGLPKEEFEEGVGPTLDPINEDSDDNAAFSDAAEALPEVGDDGFISLDAVAVSPITTTARARPTSTVELSPPSSPSVQQAAKKHQRGSADGGQSSGDWGEATAYWSKLSKQQRMQIERQHLSDDDDAQPGADAQVDKNGVSATPATVAVAGIEPAQTQPLKSALKKSAQPQPSPAAATSAPTQMRRSMRSDSGMQPTLRGDGGSLRPSVDGRPASAQANVRPVAVNRLSSSSVPGVSAPAKKSNSIRGSSAAPIVSTRLQKELANDSDSESSFRKKRRSATSSNAQGRYTMKRSMRSASVEPATSTERRTSMRDSETLNGRPLSPTRSLFNKGRGDKLRSSLRSGSVDAGTTRLSLRGPPPSQSSGRARPTSSSSAFGSSAQSSRFRSKFGADSDDEDIDEKPRRGVFRSRFADSDDEDGDDLYIPADLTPVRGIPRRSGQNDGDSTDLEDSDEEPNARKKPSRTAEKSSKTATIDQAEFEKAMEAARKKLGIAAPQEGSALQRGSLRGQNATDLKPEPKSRPEDLAGAGVSAVNTPEKKRRGLIGSILRRNRGDSTASMPTLGRRASVSSVPPSPSVPIAATNSTPTRPAALIASDTAKTPSPPSKPDFRRSAPPALKRGDSNYSTMTAPPDVIQGNPSANWPFPPPVPAIPADVRNSRGLDRPNTSDGVETASLRSGRRSSVRFTDRDDDTNGHKVTSPKSALTNSRDVYSQRTGKKKKFGLLRRAFNLND